MLSTRKSGKLNMLCGTVGRNLWIVSLLSNEQSAVNYLVKSHFMHLVMRAAVVLLKSIWWVDQNYSLNQNYFLNWLPWLMSNSSLHLICCWWVIHSKWLLLFLRWLYLNLQMTVRFLSLHCWFQQLDNTNPLPILI